MSNYLEPRQSRRDEPSDYELRLAAAIESVFAAGHHELDAVVDGLNRTQVQAPGGGAWTAHAFTSEMARLAGSGGDR